jgi:cysteine desulfurase
VNFAYLDWNATAPLLPEVVLAMQAAREGAWGNPMSVHALGRAARALLEECRERIASRLDVSSRSVVFVSGGTEANNWGLGGDGPLITSRLEHPSVTRTVEARGRSGGPVAWVEIDPDGCLSLPSLENALLAYPAATVAVMAVNHETGVIQPLAQVAELVRRFGGRLHVDAVQWCGKAPLSELHDWDTLSIAAHKLGGPKGIGALVFRGRAPPGPLRGGAQERGLRPGTQDAVLAAGFAAAVDTCFERLSDRLRLGPLRDRLEDSMVAHAVVNGSGPRLPHVSNLSFVRRSGPELVAALDLLGICVSSGSACSAGTTEPSEVVTAMVGAERAHSAVRFSLGATTTEADVDRAISALHFLLGAPAGTRPRTTPEPQPPTH